MSLPSVTSLVELALKELGSTPPTTQSILRLSAMLAQTVNRWPDLKGAQKAELVVSALREVIGLENIRGLLSAEEQVALRIVVDTVVPETLALMVGASRGEYDFRKPTPGCMVALVAALCRTADAIAHPPSVIVPVQPPVNEKEAPQEVVVAEVVLMPSPSS